MISVLALDPGFGNTKVAAADGVAVLQSAVARPREIGQAAQGIATHARPETVTLANGSTYVAGPGAWAWGDPLSTLDYSDQTSPQRLALFYAAASKLLPAGESAIDLLVIGLPVPLLQDPAQAESIQAGLTALYRGLHTFQVGAKSHQLEIHRLKAVAQPVGAYADWMLIDADGQQRQGGANAEVAVLDIGMNTLDLFVVQGWKAVPRFVGGGKLGLRRLLEMLDPGQREVEELDAALRRGKLQPTADQLNAWLGAILGHIERTWPSLRRFDAVIPTGGGAAVLGERLRSALAAKGAAVHWPEDPLTANVRGFYKWGCRAHR